MGGGGDTGVDEWELKRKRKKNVTGSKKKKKRNLLCDF